MNRLIIGASSPQEARRAAAARNCPEHCYAYLGTPDDLRGWGPDAELVLTPGFWHHPDAERLAQAALEWRVGYAPSLAQPVHGFAGSVGPTAGTMGLHVYARDTQSGAGNCVCGRHLGHHLHVQAAPGVWIPRSMRGPERVPPIPPWVGEPRPVESVPEFGPVRKLRIHRD